MTPMDVVIIVLAVLSVGGFIGVSIWRKKTGKSKGCGCGCDCSDCSACPKK